MRKSLLSMLALTVLLVAAGLRAAEDDRKPVVTASFSGYDKLMSQLRVIGRLGDNPDLGKGLEMAMQMMTQGKGLVGLDKQRPWGSVLLTDGQQFSTYGFLPVADLKQLVETLKKHLGDDIRQSDDNKDVYELSLSVGPIAQTIYLKQKGKWTFLTNKSEDLDHSPADPQKLLGDLPQKYDLAYRISVKNIPAEYREQFLPLLQAGVEAMLSRGADEDGLANSLRLFDLKRMLAQIVARVADLDDLTLGWSVDPSAGTTYLDLGIVAQSETPLAEQLASIKSGKTNFAGFSLPEAAATANWVGTLTNSDVARTKETLVTLRKWSVRQLEGEGLSDESLKQAKHLAEELCGVVQKNAESKRSDGGLVVLAEPAAVTVVAGAAMADGAKVDKIFRELAAELKKGSPVTANTIKLDAENYQGVRFHTLAVPTPKPEWTPLVGDWLKIVVGIGNDRLFVAAGREPAKTLKAAIDRSKAAGSKEVPPLRITLETARIARLVAEVAQDEQVKSYAAMAAGFLKLAGKKDHVFVTVTPAAGGIRVRSECEAGLLKALGSMSPVGGPPVGPPAAKAEKAE